MNSVMFPYEANQAYVVSNRNESEPVFQISFQNQTNSAVIGDEIMNLEERLNINNIYEEDSDGAGSCNDRTVNMIRYDSAFLRNDLIKYKNVFSNRE